MDGGMPRPKICGRKTCERNNAQTKIYAKCLVETHVKEKIRGRKKMCEQKSSMDEKRSGRNMRERKKKQTKNAYTKN